MKEPLDIYDDMPQAMKRYVSHYGWNFNKKACMYAVKRMRKENPSTKKKEHIIPTTKEQLEEIAAVIIKHDLLVITDEIYAELTYGGKHCSIATLPGMQERTVYVSGFSKAFAMTGWRLGYVAAPAEIDNAMFKIHQYAMLCAPITSQYAGIEALTDGFSDGFSVVEEMREAYDKRRRFVLNSLQEIGLECFEPRGAFYAFPSVKSTGMDSETFAERLLKEQKVAVVPGTAFGSFGANNVRLSYATGMSQLNEAFERMAAFVKKL